MLHFTQVIVSARSQFLWKIPLLLGIQVNFYISIVWAIASCSWDENASWWKVPNIDDPSMESHVQVKNFSFIELKLKT